MMEARPKRISSKVPIGAELPTYLSNLIILWIPECLFVPCLKIRSFPAGKSWLRCRLVTDDHVDSPVI